MSWAGHRALAYKLKGALYPEGARRRDLGGLGRVPTASPSASTFSRPWPLPVYVLSHMHIERPSLGRGGGAVFEGQGSWLRACLQGNHSQRPLLPLLMGMARGAGAYPFQAEVGAEPLWQGGVCLWGLIWLLEGRDSDLVGAPWISWLSSPTAGRQLSPSPTNRGGEWLIAHESTIEFISCTLAI